MKKIKTELGEFSLPEFKDNQQFSQQLLDDMPKRLVQASRIFDLPRLADIAKAWVNMPVKLDYDKYLINDISYENQD
jgi:hypothetical protein